MSISETGSDKTNADVKILPNDVCNKYDKQFKSFFTFPIVWEIDWIKKTFWPQWDDEHNRILRLKVKVIGKYWVLWGAMRFVLLL